MLGSDDEGTERSDEGSQPDDQENAGNGNQEKQVAEELPTEQKVEDQPEKEQSSKESNPLNQELQSENFDLTETQVTKIKSAMSKLKLTPPPWAKSIPEEKWLNPILYGGDKADFKIKLN